MKLPCTTIQDLLPLYHDGVCSPESRTLVEEHLSDCAPCQAVLDALSQELDQPPNSLDEAKPLLALGSAWKKGKKHAFFKGSLLALLACAVLFAAYWGLTRWKIVPVSPDVLEVSELSQLADGRILYHLNVKDDKNLYFIKFTTNPDGSYYITPMRAVLESKRGMEVGLFNEYFLVDVAESNAYQQTYGEGIVITSCYLGPTDGGILLWEDGMTLPPASEALEQMVHAG
ncbi:MAG: zf-HC2 domain-containing protein [Oscillibacter sp.]